MKIAEALDGVDRLGVDTSPFIYFVEDFPEYGPKMYEVFKQVSIGQVAVITATVTLTEVIKKPFSAGDTNLLSQYRLMLRNTTRIKLVGIDEELADYAGELRGQYNLRTADALQIAVALRTDCDAFLTNDQHFNRIRSEIPILMLDDLEIGE